MKQRPKPCQQLLQLGVWTSPAWRFCCVSSAGVGGGGIGTPSRNPVGFLSWGCRQRSRKPCLFLFSPNWRPDVVSKWKIKLACWVSYSQTICPGHKGRPPQGWPEENRCSWGQGLLLFFQSLVCKVPPLSARIPAYSPCVTRGTWWHCPHNRGVSGTWRLHLWDPKGWITHILSREGNGLWTSRSWGSTGS